MLKAVKMSYCLSLLLLLAGCGANKSQSNSSKSFKFPMESCGDSLPKDQSAYPLELYTVFISRLDESDRNRLRQKYCQRVLTGDNSYNPRQSMVTIVGSFIGREKAEQFKEILSRDFENVEISEPKTITLESLSESSDSSASSEVKKKLNNPQEIGRAALLNESQLRNLLEIDRTVAFSRGGEKYFIKVVVPTYIPKGFELTELRVKNLPKYGNEYSLVYKNANNSCFEFRGGFIKPIGGPPTFGATVDANSPALGLVPIAAVSSDQIRSQVTVISFLNDLENRDFGQFEFGSSGYVSEGESCKAMSFVEAVKVAESFQFLQLDVNN